MKEGIDIMKKQIVAGLLAASMMAGCGATGNVGGGLIDPGPARSSSARNVTADAPEIEVETGDMGDEQISSMSASSLELLQKIAEEINQQAENGHHQRLFKRARGPNPNRRKAEHAEEKQQVHIGQIFAESFIKRP